MFGSVGDLNETRGCRALLANGWGKPSYTLQGWVSEINVFSSRFRERLPNGLDCT